MEQAVRRAERKFIRPEKARNLGPDQIAVFSTRAARNAEYSTISAEVFLQRIEELGLDPNLVFADLGSGLGAACFAAAFHFKQVYGLELDLRLVAEAKRLQQKLGFGSVIFRHQDFLKADLSEFDVLYTFHPFSKNFVPLMKKRLRDIPSKTIVISNVFNYARSKIFTSEHCYH